MRSVLAKVIRCVFVVFVSALPLSACSSGNSLPRADFATLGMESVPEYRLSVGDKLNMVVFGEKNLSGPYEVNSLGQVSLPLVGEVKASGKTVAAFRESVRARYAQGYLKNPKITVDITNFRPIFVHGEVKNGGEFAFTNGLKIRDAIAKAGGYTYRADQSFVVIVRRGYPASRLELPSAIVVLPGDNIRVEERFF